MYTQCLGIFMQGILSLLIIDAIAEIPGNRKSYIGKLICLSLSLVLWLGVEVSGHWWYMAGVVFDTVLYCIYLMCQKKQKFLYMFAAVMGMNIVNAFCGFIVSAVFAVLFSDSHIVRMHYSLILIFGYGMRVIPLCILYRLAGKYGIKELFRQKRSCLAVIILGLLLQFVRISGHLLGEGEEHAVLHIAGTVLVMGLAVGCLWLADWYVNQSEKRKLWEDNRQMSRLLHRSREILPAFESALYRAKKEKDWEQLDRILEETSVVQQAQFKEEQQQELWESCYTPTGMVLLDGQIQVFAREARQKNIMFDFYAGTSVSGILKKHKIKEADFLRLTGDLLRNAFQSVEKRSSTEEPGRVLLGMGLAGGILEVEIHDNGPQFPLHILKRFGQRGNTEGGTGNGIPDILEFAARYRATYKLTEYENDSCFSKRISIIFDGRQEVLIQSERGVEISQNSIFRQTVSDRY